MNHDNIDIYQEEEDLQENEQSDDALLIAADQPADLLLIQNEIIGPVSIDRIGDHESVAAPKPVPDDPTNKKEDSSDEDDDDDESGVSDFVFSSSDSEQEKDNNKNNKQVDEEEEEGELEDGEEKEVKPQKKIQNNSKKNKKQKDEDDDDDDEFDKEKSNNPLRTKHELEQLPVEKLDIVIPPTAILTEIGQIFAIVGDTIVIESTVTDITLDADSILCSSARKVIGKVFETFGPVVQPMYSVRYNPSSLSVAKSSKPATKVAEGESTPTEATATESNENDDAATKEAELEVEEPIKVGDKVFFVKEMAKYVFAAQLKLMKGSDASNFYDEEVADAEMEFSDDEKEAEYKRALKLERTLKKRAREGTTGNESDGVDEDNAESLLNRGKRGDRGGRGGRRNSNDHTGALGMQRTYEKGSSRGGRGGRGGGGGGGGAGRGGGFDAQRDRYQPQQQDRPQHRQQYPLHQQQHALPSRPPIQPLPPKPKPPTLSHQTPQHHASMTSTTQHSPINTTGFNMNGGLAANGPQPLPFPQNPQELLAYMHQQQLQMQQQHQQQLMLAAAALQSRGGQLPPGFMAGINGGGGLDGAPFNNNGGGQRGGFNPMLMNPPMMMGMGMQGYMMGGGTGAGAPSGMGVSMGYANSGYPPYQENPESENKE